MVSLGQVRVRVEIVLRKKILDLSRSSIRVNPFWRQNLSLGQFFLRNWPLAYAKTQSNNFELEYFNSLLFVTDFLEFFFFSVFVGLISHTSYVHFFYTKRVSVVTRHTVISVIRYHRKHPRENYLVCFKNFSFFPVH